MNKTVVTRFAPSPTGSPHVGNIRTAIFAYLWAKHNNGKFLLRVEDTDRERIVPGAVEEIEETLKWLGLDFDGEKIYQSDRKEVHHKYAEQLVAERKAYKCFCTKERLDKLRADQEANKLPPGYDKHCRNLSDKEVSELEANNTPHVIRFAMPETGTAEWNDSVRGNVKIEYNLSDDQVLIKSDGWPTYHLAAVIDDHEMAVTDVIRGEEWIPSTPKHIALYNAFGWEVPNFAHMPVTLGESGKKLSKRDGDTAVSDYRKNGYLPEAMVNFLVLLGWNPKTEVEIFSMDELVKLFDLKDVNKAPAIFDLKRLDWMNGQYIRQMKNPDLLKLVKELYPESAVAKSEKLEKIIEVEKTRLGNLAEITNETDFYHRLPAYNKDLLVFKKSTKEVTALGLKKSHEALVNVDWDGKSVENFTDILAKVVEENNLTNGDVFWPVRVALSGKDRSPSPAELLWVLGKDESLKRLLDSNLI